MRGGGGGILQRLMKTVCQNTARDGRKTQRETQRWRDCWETKDPIKVSNKKRDERGRTRRDNGRKMEKLSHFFCPRNEDECLIENKKFRKRNNLITDP